MDLKKTIFRELDNVCPKHTILASNSSGLSITEIALATDRPEKVVGMHYVNPPYIIPVVEVVRGKRTSDETVEITRELLSSPNSLCFVNF